MEELPKRHPNLYSKHTPEQFKQAIDQLDLRIPSMQDHQIIVELARIVAMANDGHTRLT
ncbi:MAG: peptidase S41, partial [Aliifodinibius sp.]|nr:peptidase S41 [Fodinibius sp.]NIY29974.1 peptidase S41 [Fodinibius sp.]